MLDKPEIEFPDFPAPTDLVIEDLVIGEGDEAAAGGRVRVHYMGVAYSTGLHQVIAGWQMGIPGMKVGGRRKLIIPPHLGYGDRGAGAAIKPGETLIFVVDLLG